MNEATASNDLSDKSEKLSDILSELDSAKRILESACKKRDRGDLFEMTRALRAIEKAIVEVKTRIVDNL